MNANDSESEGWSDWVADSSEIPQAKALLSNRWFATVADAVASDKETYGIDFVALYRAMKLDFYAWTMMVNYIRSQIEKEGANAMDIARTATENISSWDDEQYLRPVMTDDLFITEFESLVGDGDLDSEEEPPIAEPKDISTLEESKAEDSDDEVEPVRDDSGYFFTYSDLEIHRTMLSDRVRTLAYRSAILNHSESIFKGANVLDIGCGTGILSLFSAQAGAAKVTGLDFATIINKARHVVMLNGYADTIELVHTKVEECTAVAAKSMDVIVSEWMGYFCVFESMLSSVILARDQWLAPGGKMFPDRCDMGIVGLTDLTQDINLTDEVSFWKDVYGFDMSVILEDVTRNAVVSIVNPELVCSSRAIFKSLDMYTVKDEDLDFESSFEIAISRDCLFGGFACYFDSFFESGTSGEVVLPTGPWDTPTHWQQTVLGLAEQTPVKAGDVVKGSIKAIRMKVTSRSYDIHLTYSIAGAESKTVLYKLD